MISNGMRAEGNLTSLIKRRLLDEVSEEMKSQKSDTNESNAKIIKAFVTSWIHK